MNRRIILPALLALVMAVCLSGPVQNTFADKEGSVHTNVTFDLSGVITNPCTGEDIIISGQYHEMYYYRIDSGGGFGGFQNGVHINTHGNAQGLSGVGVTSGDRYVMTNARNGSQLTDFYVNAQSRAEEVTVVSYINVTTAGRDNNFVIRLQEHGTFNANGELTSIKIEPLTTECR